jgi:hypothetical protein
MTDEREFLISIRNDLNQIVGSITLTHGLEVVIEKITSRLNRLAREAREET